MTDQVMIAALHQLTETRERLAVLDAREADHFKAIGEKLTELGSLTAGLGRTVKDQGLILSALQGLDQQVAQLAARVAETLPGEDGDGDPGLYRPGPAPRWWKLHGEARQQALDTLRAWVAEVYRPGYGQLAATLGPCWDQHPLCLYGLDILAELWSLLYLQAARSAAVLSAQAEFQARILPALAEQLLIETTRCGHAQARKSINGSPMRSRP
jgi:hypothetical protein